MKTDGHCIHSNRQGIASPSNWGKQIASIICLDCGEVVSSKLIDANNANDKGWIIEPK